MTDRLKPRDAKDVETAVQWALGEAKSLEVIGGGSKRALGRPSQTDLTLDLSGLAGVMLYEPDELVLSAKAGTKLSDIETLVAGSDQELAFEPMDFGPLLGTAPGMATIGGVLSVNASGPRRIKVGAARDHFLGFSAVSGRGETFKSGGRVVKNVTGYDLCKLMAGAFGTLGAMTDVTIKVLPRAETEQTLLVPGLGAARAAEAMMQAMASSCEVSGAAHLPAGVVARLPGLPDGQALTALRLEGVAPSVAHRKTLLESLMRAYGAPETLDTEASRTLWRAVRDVTPFAADGPAGARHVWRLSTAPTQGAALGAALAAEADAELIYDWSGGLIWAALAPSDDAGAALVRRAVAHAGGQATLIRAPAAIRAAIDVFTPDGPGIAALSQRIKDGFDPKGVLNPGRMWAGI
jgi:glycolate oxidase FAD binding subunit